jgi:concanavalin A-like lectin/glucanase superfamily protein/ZU5 domain-containing protein
LRIGVLSIQPVENIMKRPLLPLIPLVLLGLFACQASDSPVQPDLAGDLAPSLAILDGSREGGNPGLLWLPPIVPHATALEGDLDESLLPFLSVEICEWDGAACVGEPLAVLTSETEGAGRLHISDGDHRHYVANWDTHGVDQRAIYRVSVKAGPVELGYADVDLIEHGYQAAEIDQDEFVVVGAGWVLPVAFVVTDALDRVVALGIEGGVASLLGGGVTMEVPEGALSQATAITAQVADTDSRVPPVPAPTLGLVFEFGPDGLVFDQPVTIQISYDPDALQPDIAEERLRIHKLADGIWRPIADGSVDTDENVVRGVIDGFSFYGLFPTSIPAEDIDDADLTVIYTEIDQGALLSRATIGVWMFCDRKFLTSNCDAPSEVTGEFISQWATDRSGQGLTILEPINVLWIDYSAETQEDAESNVSDYLTAAGFETEGPSWNPPLSWDLCGLSPLNVPAHTSGYRARLNGEWIDQWPERQTWVDARVPNPNNHGRVFTTTNVGTSQDPVFYTLAAFSREGEWDCSRDNSHQFVSFTEAQTKVLGGNSPSSSQRIFGWEYDGLDKGASNILGPLTTADHDGVAVLVKTAVEAPATCAQEIPESQCEGLLARYSFDGDYQDKSGNGNNGVPVGAMFLGSDRGVGGQALVLGASGYVQIPDAPGLRLTGDFTLSAWVSSNALQSANNYVIAKGASVFDHEYALYLTNGENDPSFSVNNESSSNTELSTNVPIRYSEWTHLAVVAEDGVAQMYVNGEPWAGAAGIDPFTYSASNAPLYIGFLGPQAYTGSIDEVRIYNRALAPDEVRDLCDVRDICEGSPEGLIADYPFDGTGAAFTSDATGNGYDGVARGGFQRGTPRPGNSGGASLDLNGANAYVDIINFPTLDVQSFSICAWVNQTGDNSSASMSIVGGRTGFTSSILTFITKTQNAQDLSAQVMGSSGLRPRPTIDTGTPLQGTGWRHLCLTADTSEMTLYLDGAVVGTAPQTTSGTLPRTPHIGAYYDSSALTTHFFNGMIDDVLFFDRAITPAEVTQVAFR